VPAFRVLAADEAERLFADYERRNRLIAPLVRAVIGRLVGWRYDGTQASRRRVGGAAFAGRLPARGSD